MSVKHKFPSPRADNDDPSDIQPSHWNDEHDLTGFLALLDLLAPSPNTIFALDGTGQPQLIPKALVAQLDSPAFTGTPTAPTAGAGTSTQQLATTAFVTAAVAALLASPHFTGVPTAPTAANGTNTTQLATTAFVTAAINAIVAAAPGALDTLNELAAALGNDPNFATTVTNAIALKAPLANPGLTGVPTAPTAAQGTSTTQLATTNFVTTAVSAVSSVQGQARLSYTSPTTVTLKPVKGGLLTVNGVHCPVAAAGVPLGLTGLAANTTYFVYATQSGGIINALEASTTGHITDVTAGANFGNEVKNGDVTRTLVGMVRTTAGTQFADTPQQRFVRSWHQRQRAMAVGPQTGTVALATVAAEITTAARAEFLMWADETLDATANGSYLSATAGLIVNIWTALDGAAIGYSCVANTDGSSRALGLSTRTCSIGWAEGYHYVTPFGSVSSGAASAVNFSCAVSVG